MSVVRIHQTGVVHNVVSVCHPSARALHMPLSGVFTVCLKPLAHIGTMLTLVARQVLLVARLIKRRLADVGISVNLVDHFSCCIVYCSRQSKLLCMVSGEAS